MANRGKTYTARRKKRPANRKIPKSFIFILAFIALCLGAVYTLSGADSPSKACVQ